MTLPENGIDNAKPSASELKARTEIYEACDSERHLLGADIDLNTLEAGNSDVRLKYLVAFTEKLGISGSETAPKTLHDYEVKRRATEPSFDVTKLPEKRVSMIIRRQQELVSELDINSETKTSELIYKDRIKQLKSSGKSNVEIINALVNDESVPESERVKLRSFQAIMDIAQAVPEDAQVIGIRLNTIDFSGGIPDPKGFATWAIFDSSKLPSGVSEATQNAVAAKLGIIRHKHTVNSGGDVKDVFRKGHGTETFLDDNGEMQT